MAAPTEPDPGPSSGSGAPLPGTRVDPDAATRGTAGPAERPSVTGFPDALRDRYDPQQIAGSGTEGVVWHVRRTDTGADAAVKLAAGPAMDTELLAYLRNDAFRRHVPQLLDFGTVDHQGAQLAWVAMEYLPLTLADRFAALRQSGGGTQVEPIVGELVALLDFWQQTIRRNPVDFKPANILIRQLGGRGEQFVIADLGGVARLSASRRFDPGMQVTVPYMAPEQLAGTNHPAGPWWSLGDVLYELFAGRPRYLDAQGWLLSDQDLQLDLVMGAEVNLTAVPDPRQRLLLQGLFTRNPGHRWTAAEVRGWLAGGSPEVVRSGARTASAPAHRPITFRSTPYHDPSELAADMLRNSGDAARWLVDGAAPRLLAWLRDDVGDTVFDLNHLAEVKRGNGAQRQTAAALAVLAFGAAFRPSAVPHYRDHAIDTAGLEYFVHQPGATDFIEAMIAVDAPAVAARYNCRHPECEGERCTRLLALAELPAVMAEVDRRARELGGGRRGGDGLGTAEREEAFRRALLLTVRAEEHEESVARLSPLPAAVHRLFVSPAVSAKVAGLAAWTADAALAVRGGTPGLPRRWSTLRRRALAADPAEPAGRAALVAAEVLRHRAEPAGGATTRPATDWRARAGGWLAGAWRELPRRAGAAMLLTLGFTLLLWAGAVFRYPIDAKADIWPLGGFAGPCRRAGELAAHQVAGQLGAAIGAALVLTLFPGRGRVGHGTVTLAGAGALAIGCLRLGPPTELLNPPQAVADRVVMFEGGMGSWAGVAGLVAIVAALVLNGRATAKLLKTARTPAAKTTMRKQWQDGRPGLRDRLAFAAWSTLVLVTLLWSAVVVRLVATGLHHHHAHGTWHPGQTAASYQAGFVILLATVSLLSTLATPPSARALLVLWTLATLFLGAWPGRITPVEALRIPVLQWLFDWLASWWGTDGFWAALLLALPLAGYGVLAMVRRTSAAAGAS
ncbi:hypothetical protein ACFYNO_24335 [Kitasatospora sp. NPDC006697]|uniref:protein kinase domain-containing protein n=1 Tax=Kitasatospora sp. NPDC006697 TaxID=3364020 RepID=UPI0036771169